LKVPQGTNAFDDFFLQPTQFMNVFPQTPIPKQNGRVGVVKLHRHRPQRDGLCDNGAQKTVGFNVLARSVRIVRIVREH
jgi:hypothetical protein